MNNGTYLFHGEGITIEKDAPSSYRLTCPNFQFQYQDGIVTNGSGQKILRFNHKPEMWWDVKLLFNKKISIGKCSSQAYEKNLFVQGIYSKNMYYDNTHVLMREGKELNLGRGFDSSSIEHTAVLLVLIAYFDKRF